MRMLFAHVDSRHVLLEGNSDSVNVPTTMSSHGCMCSWYRYWQVRVCCEKKWLIEKLELLAADLSRSAGVLSSAYVGRT